MVVFNDKATVIELNNGSKAIAKCSPEDHNDPMIGFSLAYMKAKMNDNSHFRNNIEVMKKDKITKFDQLEYLNYQMKFFKNLPITFDLSKNCVTNTAKNRDK